MSPIQRSHEHECLGDRHPRTMVGKGFARLLDGYGRGSTVSGIVDGLTGFSRKLCCAFGAEAVRRLLRATGLAWGSEWDSGEEKVKESPLSLPLICAMLL